MGSGRAVSGRRARKALAFDMVPEDGRRKRGSQTLARWVGDTYFLIPAGQYSRKLIALYREPLKHGRHAA